MRPSARTYTPGILMLGIWMLIYYLSGVISLKFDDPQLHISIVWFPAGVATAAFLLSRWRLWPVLIVAFVLLNLLLDNITLSQLPIDTLYAVLSLPSSLAIAWIVRRFSRPDDDLNIIAVWFISTIIISLLDAFLFGLGFSLAHKDSFFDIFWTGFVSNITGIFFATTVIMGFMNNRLRSTDPTWQNLTRRIIIWLALAAVSLWIFSDSAKVFSAGLIPHHESLVFALTGIPIILAALLTLYWGNTGGSIALLTVAAIVIYYTDKGVGPFLMHGLHEDEPLLLVQSYLTATTLLLVFIRVMTHSINRFNPENGLQLQQQAIYQLDLSNGKLYWNNLPPALAMIPPSILSNKRNLLMQLHPQDRHTLAEHWQTDAQQQTLPTINFRLQDEHGHWIYITDSGAVFIEHQGALFILGNWSVSAG